MITEMAETMNFLNSITGAIFWGGRDINVLIFSDSQMHVCFV